MKQQMCCNTRERACKGKIMSVMLLIILFSTSLGLSEIKTLAHKKFWAIVHIQKMVQSTEAGEIVAGNPSVLINFVFLDEDCACGRGRVLGGQFCAPFVFASKS